MINHKSPNLYSTVLYDSTPPEIELKRNQDYYVILTLDRTTTASHGFYFDVAFSFSKYDKPIVVNFEEGFSEEFPIIVNQTLFFFTDVSDNSNDKIILYFQLFKSLFLF